MPKPQSLRETYDKAVKAKEAADQRVVDARNAKTAVRLEAVADKLVEMVTAYAKATSTGKTLTDRQIESLVGGNPEENDVKVMFERNVMTVMARLPYGKFYTSKGLRKIINTCASTDVDMSVERPTAADGGYMKVRITLDANFRRGGSTDVDNLLDIPKEKLRGGPKNKCRIGAKFERK